MLQNFGPCFGVGSSLFTFGVTAFGQTFTIINPIKNQIGLALWTGTTGIEIAGGGISYGPSSITLISGVTTTLTFMNSNGSSLLLVGNGSGLPIWNGMFAPISIAGAPMLWMTAGTTALSMRVTYFFNDGFNNQ